MEDQSEEHQSLIGNSESPEKMYLEESLKEEIEKCIAVLTEREKEVIVAYFGLKGKEPKTLKGMHMLAMIKMHEMKRIYFN